MRPGSGGNRTQSARNEGREGIRPLRCNKEMRIFLPSPYTPGRGVSPLFAGALGEHSNETLDSRRRGAWVIRNRCLFYETFYLAAQPAFQYFARLRRLVHDLSPSDLSFILTVIPPSPPPPRFIMSTVSSPFSCVPLRLSSWE